MLVEHMYIYVYEHLRVELLRQAFFGHLCLRLLYHLFVRLQTSAKDIECLFVSEVCINCHPLNRHSLILADRAPLDIAQTHTPGTHPP